MILGEKMLDNYTAWGFVEFIKRRRGME